MNINSINRNINFGRIIKIEIINPKVNYEEKQNAKEHFVEAARSNINCPPWKTEYALPGWFNGLFPEFDIYHKNLFLQKHNNQDYLVFGEEAEQISKIKKAVEHNLVSKKKAQKQIDKIFRENVEDGQEKKGGGCMPNTVFRILLYGDKYSIKEIGYYSVMQNGEYKSTFRTTNHRIYSAQPKKE